MPRLSTLSNPTGLIDLEKNRITIVKDDAGSSLSFSLVRLDLSRLSLPSTLNVVVIVRRGNSEERIELGEVSNWDKSFRLLTEIGSEGTWTFRVLLLQPGSSRLIAAGENIRPDGEGDSTSFIALEPADLGQRPWDIQIIDLEGRVVIRFSREIYLSATEAEADKFFVGLILPEAIRRLSEWIGRSGALEDPVWEPFKSWLVLHGVNDEANADSEDSIQSWSDEVVGAFCNRFEFASKLKELRIKGMDE